MCDEASLVIIKRSGADGPHFPLRRKEYLFGSDVNCDLRVQIPGVAMEHAKIIRTMDENEFDLENLTDKEILVNGKAFKETVHLHNMDVFSIENRSFRFECGDSKENLKSKSPKMTRKSTGILQETNKCNEPSGVKDSPYTPRPRRPSLRESLGQLRRQSVQFKEEDESSSFKSFEANENHQVTTVPPKKVPSACSTPQRNLKRVSFGPVLSPEQFIKELPVMTPVRKGATPRRMSVPLAKSCLSPARRRYSVAATSFVSKIIEEEEEDDDESDSDDESDETSSSDESSVIFSPESPKSKRKRLATPVRKEIEQGTKLRQRQRTKKMATPLRNAIKNGFRLKATKKKLQAPLKRQIAAGLSLRQTKKKLATPIRHAIKGKPKLRATRNRMVTPVRKEIEAKPSLRPTKKVMCKELQGEIRNGVTLRETKKVMPKELQEKIKAGRTLRKIKRSMKPELQEEIVKGKEPSRAKATKKSLKTPLRKEIEKGARLRSTKTQGVEISSKTPKRRRSATDESDHQSSRVVTKKLKTPNKTPGQAAFHPITKARQRSIGRSRRKSTKQPPSYAEILKRPKLTAKRRLTDRRTSVHQFQAEQELANKTKAKSSTTTATMKVPKSKSKTPTRRKSQAKPASKKTNERKAEDEWQVVLNKRKIIRIKRQRAVKSKQEKVEDDFSGVDVLFKTPKPVRVQPMKNDTPMEVETCATTLSPLGRKSLGLTGVRGLMKTPKEEPEVRFNGIRELMKTPKEGPEVRLNGIRELMMTPKEGPEVRFNGLRELMKTPRDAQGIASPNYVGVKRMFSSAQPSQQQVNYDGVAELFEVLEMASPLTATRTPSLRRTAEKITAVTPMVPSCTPSLRRRSDKNEVVTPLHSANTPSLRNAKDTVVVTTLPVLEMTSPAHVASSSNKASEEVEKVAEEVGKVAEEVEKLAEQQKTEPPKRSARSRTKPENAETESDDVVEMPSSSTARQAKPRGKRAAPSDLEEPSAKSRKLPSEPVVVKTTRARRGQASKPSNAAVIVETNTRTSRSTRGRKKETKPSEAPIPPVAATPKIPVSSCKSKNVPGIPETPQPLTITRTKLETIIEVPTPALSVRGTAAPKTERVQVPIKNSRSKRNLKEEPVVQEPVIAIPKRSSRRTKPAVPSIKEEEKVDEHSPGVRGKRFATRARNNNQKESEVVVKEVGRTRGEKAVVGKEPVEEQCSRAVRITRPKRGAVVEHLEKVEAAKVEKEVEVTIEVEVKRPRRGRKVEETKTPSEDCEDGGKPKHGATRSTAKRTAKKDETSSKTQKKQNTKIQEKATVSPVATRVTRSRRNK